MANLQQRQELRHLAVPRRQGLKRLSDLQRKEQQDLADLRRLGLKHFVDLQRSPELKHLAKLQWNELKLSRGRS
ncbi:hypothetical protein AMECASPLE_039633 [Ameca splendens]|uniref:Uncharacterized protein n=1 Tax=Ameca splendens TaxID=208324 RepID=A0ABV0ZU07_9TELE